MTYDKDLKQIRWICRFVIGANLITAGRNFWAGNWLMALASIIWALAMATVYWSIRGQQKTRDEARVAMSAINAIMEREKL